MSDHRSEANLNRYSSCIAPSKICFICHIVEIFWSAAVFSRSKCWFYSQLCISDLYEILPDSHMYKTFTSKTNSWPSVTNWKMWRIRFWVPTLVTSPVLFHLCVTSRLLLRYMVPSLSLLLIWGQSAPPQAEWMAMLKQIAGRRSPWTTEAAWSERSQAGLQEAERGLWKELAALLIMRQIARRCPLKQDYLKR